METIISIEEGTFTHLLDYEQSYDGYIITTSEQVIKVGVSNDQCCCENWGYLSSEDDLKRFIGTQLLDVKVTDEFLNKDKVIEIYEGGCMFVDIETSDGVFQIVVYNEHNGYYGHDAVLITKESVYNTIC